MRSCSLGRVLRMESIVSLVIINLAPALELLLLLNFHFLDYDGLKVSLNQFSHQSVIASLSTMSRILSLSKT